MWSNVRGRFPAGWAVALVVALGGVSSARAGSCPGEQVLMNDDCDPGCTIAVCPCFVFGEIVAAQFEVPAEWYPIEILRVRIDWRSFFGGAQAVLGETIIVYNGDTFPNPGQEIFAIEGPQLIDGGLNEFDIEALPGEVIVNSGKFTIGLEIGEDNANDPFAPSVGSDDSGCQPGKNMVFVQPGGGASPGWHDACSLGVSGDWLIRVVVRCVDSGALRTLFVQSDPVGALVNTGNGFFPAPVETTVQEDETISLSAFLFGPGGEPFAFWELDDQFLSNETNVSVVMDTGGDRTALAVYGDAGFPPEIVHALGLPGETRPHSGYIDPRQETLTGLSATESIDSVTIVFSEPVANVGGAPLSADAFSVSVTGGVNPGIASIDASQNPTVEVFFAGPLPIREWTTIRAEVEDVDGNPIGNDGDRGPLVDEVDRVDIGVLPGDIDQNGTVQPIDLFFFRQFATDAFEPGVGIDTDYVDTNRDGVITPIDLFRFRQLIVGVNSTFAWGDPPNNTMLSTRP
jgi:Dockerin type I domain